MFQDPTHIHLLSLQTKVLNRTPHYFMRMIKVVQVGTGATHHFPIPQGEMTEGTGTDLLQYKS